MTIPLKWTLLTADKNSVTLRFKPKGTEMSETDNGGPIPGER